MCSNRPTSSRVVLVERNTSSRTTILDQRSASRHRSADGSDPIFKLAHPNCCSTRWICEWTSVTTISTAADRGRRRPLVRAPGGKRAPRHTCASADGRSVGARRSAPWRWSRMRGPVFGDTGGSPGFAPSTSASAASVGGLRRPCQPPFTEVTAADPRRARNGTERKASVRAVTTKVVPKSRSDEGHQVRDAVLQMVNRAPGFAPGRVMGGVAQKRTRGLAWRLSGQWNPACST